MTPVLQAWPHTVRVKQILCHWRWGLGYTYCMFRRNFLGGKHLRVRWWQNRANSLRRNCRCTWRQMESGQKKAVGGGTPGETGTSCPCPINVQAGQQREGLRNVLEAARGCLGR
jgi:hypothetical protein